MWSISFKSVTITALISIAWFFGFQEMYIVFADFSNQWYWFVLATIWTTTIHDVFGHMTMSHTLYPVNTKSITYKLLTFLMNVDHGWGPLTTFCMGHGRHHSHADQGSKDPNNPRLGWFTNGSVSPLLYLYDTNADWGDEAEYKKYTDMQTKRFKEVFDDNWTFITEEYSHYLTVAFWVLLFFTLPVILFKIVFLGRALLSIYTVFSASFGHLPVLGSYRNFDTPDTSHNHLILHWISLGVFPTILQNNHHGAHYTLKDGGAAHWYEWDLSKYLARIIRLGLEKKADKPFIDDSTYQ
jgi:hypothetical protein